MIAPHERAGKGQDLISMPLSQKGWGQKARGQKGRSLSTARPHGFFNNIIILPKFGQARAKLECDMRIVAQARSAFEHRIPQPPAPRGLELIGPESLSQRALLRKLRFKSCGSIQNRFASRLSRRLFCCRH